MQSMNFLNIQKMNSGLSQTLNNLLPAWIDEWNEALNECDLKKYNYAVSNPFFEIWLLLYHTDSNLEDRLYAVTEEHEYEPTGHFRERLRDVGAPLKDTKHIRARHYDSIKIEQAVMRAKTLHTQKEERYPKYFATTVYLLIEKILELLPK